MNMRELHSNALVETLLAPAVVAASVNSAGLDMQGNRWSELLISVGDFAFSGANKLTLAIQEANQSDFSDAATPSDYEVLGAASGVIAVLDESADKEKTYKVGYIGIKRYVRIVITEEGTVSVPVSVVGVKGGGGVYPKDTTPA